MGSTRTFAELVGIQSLKAWRPAAYRVGSHLSVFVLADNLLDAGYSTFGVLGDATDVLGPTYDSPRFLGVGAPRAAWLGVDVND